MTEKLLSEFAGCIAGPVSLSGLAMRPIKAPDNMAKRGGLAYGQRFNEVGQQSGVLISHGKRRVTVPLK